LRKKELKMEDDPIKTPEKSLQNALDKLEKIDGPAPFETLIDGSPEYKRRNINDDDEDENGEVIMELMALNGEMPRNRNKKLLSLQD
jgi:hypothetical protein